MTQRVVIALAAALVTSTALAAQPLGTAGARGPGRSRGSLPGAR